MSASAKYARLRLSFDSAASNPAGRVSSGEIEDYSFVANVTQTTPTTVAPTATSSSTTIVPATVVPAVATTTTLPVVGTTTTLDAKKATAGELPATGYSSASLALFSGLLLLSGSVSLLRRRLR